MRALVTGAGGFLGHAIAARLRAAEHEVRGFSRGHYPELDELGVEQHRGDLADGEAVCRAVTDCDVVFHVAARPGSWGRYRDYYDANVRGTEHILTACRTAGVRNLVYTSTPSVVSRGADLEGVDESLALSTSFKAHYPKTKAMAERAVQAANGVDLRTVSLRPHLVWGPRDGSLLPRLVERARAGKLRRIAGPEKLIDTTYIDDAVTAHVLAAERLQADDDNVAGQAYFISSGTPIGTWTMINRLLAATGMPPIAKTISPRVAYAAGCVFELIYGALRIQSEPPTTRWVVDELRTAHWYDISAARRDLGYEPAVSLDEGMARLADWWNARG